MNTRFATQWSLRSALPDAVSRDFRAHRMRNAIAILGLLATHAPLAAEVPGINPGDYLLVYAQIVECGSELQAIEAAQVNDDGVLTLFGNASLVAAGKPVHQVRNELLDEMERRTGHRSQTLELVYVPGADKEAAAKRLVRFSGEVERRCSRKALPPYDLDEDWVKTFEKLVNSARTAPCRAAGRGAPAQPHLDLHA